MPAHYEWKLLLSRRHRSSNCHAAVIRDQPAVVQRTTVKSLNAVLDFFPEILSRGGGSSRSLQVNSADFFFAKLSQLSVALLGFVLNRLSNHY